jgi:chromosomal replication initiation ATPase DnaA
MAERDGWALILECLQREMDGQEFQRWFGTTAYASDSGDQITVWVASESIRRHIMAHYHERIHRALMALGRHYTDVRLIVAGFGDDDEEGEEDEDDDDD